MASLKIVQSMVQHQTLSLEQTTTLLPLLTDFGSHPSQPCRLVMYEILITVYNNYRLEYMALSHSHMPFLIPVVNVYSSLVLCSSAKALKG